MLFSWLKKHAAPKHGDAETTKPDWRNEPATEQQKEKLRFVGCTWSGDITVGQAEAALDECAKQFPHVEAVYQNYLHEKTIPASEWQKEKLRYFGCTWSGDISVRQAKEALEQCAKQFPHVEASYGRYGKRVAVSEPRKIKSVGSLAREEGLSARRIESEARQEGEQIQKRAFRALPKGFHLDMAKIASIRKETNEVAAILSSLMEEDLQDSIALPKSASLAAPEILTIPADGRTAPRFSGLDSAFQPILERLLARDSWPPADFNALAREFHFMPLNIRDTLNEWADEVLGDFILDGEDPVVIRRELIAKETI